MITISTGGIGPMDIMANTKAKGASKDEEKAVDAFASLMNMVSTRQEQPESVVSDELEVSNVAQTKDYEEYSKQQGVDAAKDKLQSTEKTTAKEDTQAEIVKKTDSKTERDEQMVDKAVAIIKKVKTALKETLGITDEELDGLLADMGINISDLLLGDNLKNFILQAQGATNVELLVNEDLANLVTDLTNQVTEIINQFEVGDQDVNIQQFLIDNAETIESALQSQNENVDITIDDVNDKIDDNQILNAEDVQVEDSDSGVAKTDAKTNNQIDSNIGDGGISEKVTIETTSDNRQAMSQEQSEQQIATGFNQALDNTVNANVNVDATAFASNVQEADIIRQIIDQIKVNAGREVQSMEVQLNPENLGKVYVNVEAKDGVMQAKIIAETEAAKNAIENNLAVLKENFSNNELKVEAIEVMVAAYGFFEESQNENFGNQEQANDTSKSIGGINVNSLDEELTEEEELEVEIMKSKGNTVSYTV